MYTGELVSACHGTYKNQGDKTSFQDLVFTHNRKEIEHNKNYSPLRKSDNVVDDFEYVVEGNKRGLSRGEKPKEEL